MRESAVADAYMLLSVLVDYPESSLVDAMISGSVRNDALAIAFEAGLPGGWEEASALCGLPSDRDDGDPASMLSAMRIEHTRLFDHPEHPVVYPYEGQFLYMEDLARREGQAQQWGMAMGSGRTLEGSLRRKEEGAGRPLSAEDYFDERPRMFVNPAALDAERCYKAFGLMRSETKNIPGDSIVTELQFMSWLHAERARALSVEDEAAFEKATAGIEEFERIHMRKWAQSFFEKIAAEARIEPYRVIGKMGAGFIAWRLKD